MTETLITALVMSFFINIVLYRLFSSERGSGEDIKDRLIELERMNERLVNQSEDEKKLYSAERKTLILENRNYSAIISDMEKALSESTSEKRKYYAEMDNIDSSAKEMIPADFLKLRQKVISRNGSLHDFTGIYVLENKSHNKFYVGQSISLFRRAGSHFTGDGNKDIYEDYLRGDEWTIKLIALSNSGFKSINALEKHFIKYHSSTHNGYNKTIGNVN